MFNVTVFTEKDGKQSRIAKYPHPSNDIAEAAAHVVGTIKKMGAAKAAKISRVQIDAAGVPETFDLGEESAEGDKKKK